MARRTRSFLFDNISKRLVQNTNKTAKEINTRKSANTVANTDILTSKETETKISTTISNTGINTLSDISIANVVSDQVLQYNANTGNWENETLSLVSSVDGLTDTNFTSLSNGDYLVYSSSGSEWINRSLDLSSYVTDTDIADYSNTAQMNTAIDASNTAMKSYVDSEVANVDFSAYSTTTQMNTAIASSNTAMKNYVDAEVAGIVNSAPAALDTLNELAAALGDDANFSTTTSTALGNRLRIDVSNQSLTSTQQTNALTNLGITATVTELNYVDGVTSNIQTQLDAKGTSSFSGAYADLTGKPSLFSGAYADLTGKPTIPTNNNQLTNGAGYITSSSLSSYATSTDLTDGTITKINSQATVGDSIEFFQNDGGGNLGIRFNANYNNAVEDGSAWEFEFANDSTSGDFRIYYDGSISTAGEAISWTEAFRLDGGDSSLYIFGDKVWDAGNLTNLNQLTNGPGYITGITSSMVTTALGYTPGTSSFSGSYNDLSNKPTIPTNNNQLTNGAGYITSSSLSSYLPTSGGTISGNLTVNSGGHTNLVVDGNGGSGYYQNIHVGESATGSAALHIQYRGDGYAWIGMGDTSSGTTLMAYAAMQMYYQSNDLTILGDLKLNTIADAPAEWNPVLLEDGGWVKKDAAVKIHGDGYIQAAYVNMTHGAVTRSSDTVFYSSNDNYIRKTNASGMKAALGLSTVASSGSYNDLSNKPTIPTNNNQLTNGAGYLTSNVNANIDMNNYAITNLNDITFNDPGPNEGIKWIGGSDWRIYESPDNLTTNSGGNLQFVTGTTRRMTLNTSGQLQTYSYQGHSNVAGTGNASYHPSGVYSTGTNWLYGTIHTNNNAISAGTGAITCGAITASGVIDANAGAGAINITNSDIRSSASSNWTGNPGANGKIQYHSNRWYIVADSSSNRIVQFRRNGADKSYIDNNGTFIGNISGSAGSVAWSNVTGKPTIPTNNNQLTNGAGYITNGSSYNVNNAWLRENGDNADVKLYGNSRQMTFRTDGVSGGTGGHTGYPFRWTYGGDASGNSEMLLNTSGQLWLANYGWLHDAFLRKNATDTQTNTINMNGYFVGGADGHRHKGIYGNYNSYRINHIWSMGTGYIINSNGSNFGNLYGMAYTYNNRVYTSNAMGGGHQMVWCQNGGPYCALGNNIWTSGNVTAYSDIRVKENLEIIPNALEKVKKLNGYTFDRTDIETDSEGNTPRKRQTGVVAQEVLEVLPEVVTGNEDNPDGHLSVAYGNMVGLLIEAIKEQQEQIEELKARLQ